jgi:hypothetical protein
MDFVALLRACDPAARHAATAIRVTWRGRVCGVLGLQHRFGHKPARQHDELTGLNEDETDAVEALNLDEAGGSL